MAFRDLVKLVRSAVGAHAPIIRVPPSVMAATARALGLLVHDVVLTPDEIKGLMAGLLVSHEAPRGRIVFSQWLDQHRASIGRAYANELDRHFAPGAETRAA
jgi:NADH dehydrogenase